MYHNFLVIHLILLQARTCIDMHTTDLAPLLMYLMFQVFSVWFDTISLPDCSQFHVERGSQKQSPESLLQYCVTLLVDTPTTLVIIS